MIVRRSPALAVIAVCLLFTVLMCGCMGKGGDPSQPALVTPSVQKPSDAPPAASTPEDPQPSDPVVTAPPADPVEPELPELPEDVDALREKAENFVVVSSTKELIDAIAPDTAILVEPGYYNLSEYLQAAWEDSGEEWNWLQSLPYVEVETYFDGVGLVIENADGLSIFGRGNTAETELVIEPRYADVIRFQYCDELSLSRLTLGHTETGECVGSVLRFDLCSEVDLNAMDLYGCGVNGIYADNTCDLRVRDSVIRDCSYGPIDLTYISGVWLFEDCVMSGSSGGAFIDTSAGAEVNFVRCTFGENESNALFFREDITTEDCVWHEITQYPEYPDIEPGLEGNLRPVRFDAEVLADTAWLGESMYNFETQEETMLPLRREGCNIDVILRLSADGSGTLAGLEDDPLQLRWEMAGDSDYYADIFMQGEYAESGSVELYADTDADESPLWMEMWLGDISVRFTYWDEE
ncbi:MAG: hypothetical protein IKR07_00090 [Oscillospiraceae bacterium]|nr:hypothetical protein [Oscillospiraceae bacterium]